MNTDLITATILLGPAALLGTAAGAATLRHRPEDRARAAVLADLRAAHTADGGPDDDPTPPDGGQPTPVPQETAPPVVRLAPVIPLPARPAAPLRRAA